MTNLASRSSAALAACLLLSTPLLAQAPAPAPRPPIPPPMTSEELARQPQAPGATGDQQRHYRFEAAGVESPYRLYVPKSYDGKTPLPVVVALHGAGGDHNYFFKLIKDLPQDLEKRGVIFVEPMGYHTFGGYGAGPLPKVTVPLDPGVEPNRIGALRPPWTPQELQTVNDLSEQDVMNVLAIVQKEYAVDPSRIYLMGHSMGGMGTWYLGQKYVDRWAALGPMSGGFGYVDYPLQRLKGVPIFATAGGKDTAMHGPQAQAEFARFKAAGLDVNYVEIADGTHMSNIPAAFPQVLDFLLAHRRAGR